MWFGIEGNPRWLLEMFSVVNRKTNGSVKKVSAKHQAPTSREAPSIKIQHPGRSQNETTNRIFLELVAWNFSGCWMLNVGAFLGCWTLAFGAF